MITIERIQNGVLVRESGEGAISFVFDEQNILGLVEFLYDLNMRVGVPGNKHDMHRIQVNVVHGSSYKCTDKECSICRGGSK